MDVQHSDFIRYHITYYTQLTSKSLYTLKICINVRKSEIDMSCLYRIIVSKENIKKMSRHKQEKKNVYRNETWKRNIRVIVASRPACKQTNK